MATNPHKTLQSPTGKFPTHCGQTFEPTSRLLFDVLAASPFWLYFEFFHCGSHFVVSLTFMMFLRISAPWHKIDSASTLASFCFGIISVGFSSIASKQKSIIHVYTTRVSGIRGSSDCIGLYFHTKLCRDEQIPANISFRWLFARHTAHVLVAGSEIGGDYCSMVLRQNEDGLFRSRVSVVVGEIIQICSTSSAVCSEQEPVKPLKNWLTSGIEVSPIQKVTCGRFVVFSDMS